MKLPHLFVPVFLALSVAASASVIQFNYNFSITGMSGPIPTASGSFSGYFTPMVPVGTDVVWIGTNPSTLTSINFNFDGVTYTLANTVFKVQNASSLAAGDFQGAFTLGGSQESFGLLFGTRDFAFLFFDSGSGEVHASNLFIYTTTSFPSQAFSTDNPNAKVTITSISVPDSTSLGGTLGLLALGILSVAAVSRQFDRRVG